MTKIHWVAYLLIGSFVSLVSFFRYESLKFFFYAGVLFIAVGIVKLVFSITKDKDEKVRANEQLYTNKVQHHHQFKYCSRCRNVLKIHDRFCSRCGSRV